MAVLSAWRSSRSFQTPKLSRKPLRCSGRSLFSCKKRLTACSSKLSGDTCSCSPHKTNSRHTFSEICTRTVLIAYLLTTSGIHPHHPDTNSIILYPIPKIKKRAPPGKRSLPISAPRVLDADVVRDHALEFSRLQAQHQAPGADDVGNGLDIGFGEIGGGHGMGMEMDCCFALLVGMVFSFICHLYDG